MRTEDKPATVETEFVTVQRVLESDAETMAVDAFALSLIKHERQLRRLFTYSVFQFPSFQATDVTALRSTLAKSDRIYADGFLRGLEVLWPKTMAQLIGPRNDDLTKSLKQATEARNKIFHGQITELGLGRATLLVLVHDLREWCTLLGQAATALVGYDGFGRDSYRKGADATLHTRFAAQIKSVAEYETFLKSHVERPRKAAKKP